MANQGREIFVPLMCRVLACRFEQPVGAVSAIVGLPPTEFRPGAPGSCISGGTTLGSGFSTATSFAKIPVKFRSQFAVASACSLGRGEGCGFRKVGSGGISRTIFSACRTVEPVSVVCRDDEGVTRLRSSLAFA